MARSTMEVAFLGVQKTEVEGTRYVKLFYGDEPDGKTEHGLSIIAMGVVEEAIDEVFASCASLAPLETIRITFDVARGGKNLGKNLALHIEPAKPREQAQRPTQQPNQIAKPAAPADAAKS
ncbi:hypothetical protein [Aquipseudomonas alcaligenes]|uniref:Uncharacterized protein n=1 Tax=Aquipseudomonas alcaligenes TaxID=43263 RepID=A0A1N6V6Z3_AQUAC|nr:hypothetical protein [Pseudomonas alcaligenes]SIQ73509.1 hypothetical protein SAMN05878282_107146 [Pseudomonas alcaligenes]